jgi:nucleotide-binding universal stress UspA family protein
MTTNASRGAVVVGYDGTQHSDIALDWAVRYARLHGRTVLVVNAAGTPTAYDTFGSVVENRKELRILGRRATDRALVRARDTEPHVDVTTHVALGNAQEVLLGCAEDAHLLVVGSRGRGSLASLLLGSVSVGVSAHAPCPVVVVRSGSDRARTGPFAGRIVVGVDGSEASTGALDLAFELASTELKPLAIVHAWGDPGAYRDMQSHELRAERAEEHALRVAESMAGFAEKYPDVLVTEHQVDQDAGRTLVAASLDADTVVVGTRGRADVVAVVLGSVSRHVVERAQCPVIVVRGGTS